MKKSLCLFLILFSQLFSLTGQQLQQIDIEHVSVKIRSPKNLVGSKKPVAYVITEKNNALYDGFPAITKTEYAYNEEDQLIRTFEWIIQESYRGQYQLVTVTQYDGFGRTQSKLVYQKGRNHFPYKWPYHSIYSWDYNVITRTWMLKEAYNVIYTDDSDTLILNRICREPGTLDFNIENVKYDHTNNKVEYFIKDYSGKSSDYEKKIYMNEKLFCDISYKEKKEKSRNYTIENDKIVPGEKNENHKISFYWEKHYVNKEVPTYDSCKTTHYYKNGYQLVSYKINRNIYDTLCHPNGIKYPKTVVLYNKRHDVIYKMKNGQVYKDLRDNVAN